MASAVAIDSVSLIAGDRTILRDVTLHIAPGESVALIGRSGAGKTTLLRLLNGLATPTSGVVTIDGAPMSGDLAARRRRIGTMLQAPALFPHRTIYENVATVPRLLGWDEDRTRNAARELLAQLELPFDRFASRFPRSLSGGEQQRVGIARAMIAEPPLLLCDEPFSAVDPLVRRELQESFIRLRDRGGVTMVFVTHDLAEALRVGERVVLVDDGAVVCDEPRARFLASEHSLVRRFLDAARIPEAS
ncbi:MAG TPA: ATP-binding cassette domain-containing protein [Thermoanaerobaculia bacterium]|jgi:osmoprotectant transport system ATP-binding protein|nr:ATP-binding cassette domain-containing protein [Thermoanaerobaculia bacterium]